MWTKIINVSVILTEKGKAKHISDELRARLVEECVGGVWFDDIIADRHLLFTARNGWQAVAEGFRLYHQLSVTAHH